MGLEVLALLLPRIELERSGKRRDTSGLWARELSFGKWAALEARQDGLGRGQKAIIPARVTPPSLQPDALPPSLFAHPSSGTCVSWTSIKFQPKNEG
jgi:hypothetical protein